MGTLAVVPQEQQLTRTTVLSEDAQQDVDGFRAIQYAAKIMSKSGCFADIKGIDEETAIAKAVVKIAIGRDYGFSAAESMQHIELIQGRPSIAAHARAAKMKAAGYTWKFRKFDSTICHIDIYDKSGELLGDSSFSMEDAKRMGLDGKDNWKKNPRNMLYCRAISNAQRWYAPEVLSASLISKEELQDESPYQHERLAPIRASISLDSVTAGKDENRGHNATKAQPVIEFDREAAVMEFQANNLIEMKKGLPVFSEMPPVDLGIKNMKFWVRDGVEPEQRYVFDVEMKAYLIAPEL